MSFVVTPINVAASGSPVYQCPDNYGVTDGLFTGDASFAYGPQPYGYILYNTTGASLTAPDATTGRIYTGKVRIGFCCVVDLSIEMNGVLEAYRDGFDWARIKVNGTQVWYYESVQQVVSGVPVTDPYATYSYTDTAYITLTPNPCGNIIEIEASTGDVDGNNAVEWSAILNTL